MYSTSPEQSAVRVTPTSVNEAQLRSMFIREWVYVSYLTIWGVTIDFGYLKFIPKMLWARLLPDYSIRVPSIPPILLLRDYCTLHFMIISSISGFCWWSWTRTDDHLLYSHIDQIRYIVSFHPGTAQYVLQHSTYPILVHRTLPDPTIILQNAYSHPRPSIYSPVTST